MKYKIEILETLRRVVEVDAKNEEEAVDRIGRMYYNSDIVLGADDFDNEVVFNLLENEE